MQLTADQLAHVLHVWPVARLGTLHPGGTPQLVPIVFVADGLAIYTPIDGKPKRGDRLQRLNNVGYRRDVCVLLDLYDDDWQALWWLRMDGVADALVRDGATDAEFFRVEAMLRTKYPQYATVDAFRAQPTMLRVTPIRHVAWSARPVEWSALAR